MRVATINQVLVGAGLLFFGGPVVWANTAPEVTNVTAAQTRLRQLFLGGWRFRRLRGVFREFWGRCGRNVVPLSTGCE